MLYKFEYASKMLCFSVRIDLLSFHLLAERRKIERRIRRLEKQQRTSSGKAQETEISEQLAKLKEDLEYVRVSF